MRGFHQYESACGHISGGAGCLEARRCFHQPFSDRCFPTSHQAVGGTSSVRAGVASCHEAACGSDKASTFALAGAPRPPDDDYAMQMPDADAVYAVWARKR